METGDCFVASSKTTGAGVCMQVKEKKAWKYLMLPCPPSIQLQTVVVQYGPDSVLWRAELRPLMGTLVVQHTGLAALGASSLRGRGMEIAKYRATAHEGKLCKPV